MTLLDITMAEGYGAHVRSVRRLAAQVEGIDGGTLISRNLSNPQTVPIHDGSAGTEITLDFGTLSDDVVSASSGELTLLRPLLSLIALIEFNIVKTGGASVSELAYWAETSVDDGVTWVPVANSLRRREFDKDGSGVFAGDLSIEGALAAGVKFRVRATDTGAGTLQFALPATLTTSDGDVDGYISKLVIEYKIDEGL